MKKYSTKEIVNALSEIHSSAMDVVDLQNATNDTDTSQCEGLLNQIHEFNAMGVNTTDVDEKYSSLIDLCLSFKNAETLSDLECELEDFPKLVASALPEDTAVHFTLKGVEFLSRATQGLDDKEKAEFAVRLSDLLEDYDLLGNEAVLNIFKL